MQCTVMNMEYGSEWTSTEWNTKTTVIVLSGIVMDMPLCTFLSLSTTALRELNINKNVEYQVLKTEGSKEC